MIHTEKPLVSVLMTVYNREQYLKEAIQSVINSEYHNLELIIVDDNSTDSSFSIAQQCRDNDSRIRLYRNKENLTDYPNRKMAASYAKGKYLKYVDSDDVLYPFGLCILVNRMEQFPTAVLGLAKRGLKDQPFPKLLAPYESYMQSFFLGNFLFGNAPTSVIIRRDAFEATGGFSGLNQVGDVEYWMTLAAKHPIVLIEGDVTWNRDHSSSEKYKDSARKKDELILSLKLEALKSKDCPLPLHQRKVAAKMLIEAHKKANIEGIMRTFAKKTKLMR